VDNSGSCVTDRVRTGPETATENGLDEMGQDPSEVISFIGNDGNKAKQS
jgi:hypothetical protein